jgi:hypothetical protein
MNIDDRIKNIKTQWLGATGKRVFLVEGPDDEDAFRIFLDHRPQAAGWESRWHIEPAGNKGQVLSILKLEPTWLGVVDRDEWTVDECNAAVRDAPNLMLLPRFCLESYLVDPQEIWPALGPIQQAKIVGGLPTLVQAVMAHRVHWARHAALWHAINPLWRSLRKQGFNDGVLDPSQPPLSNEALRAILDGWNLTLDASAILSAVQASETRFAAADATELLTQWIYAKKFYPMVVHAVLNQFLGQMSEKSRRLKILRHMARGAVPADLAPLWLAMGV